MTKEEIIKEIDNVVTPWLVLNFKNEVNVFECKNCGATMPTPAHCELNLYINLLRGFKMTHWECIIQEDLPEAG